MKNLWVMPTDKPSKLYKNISEELSFASIEFKQQKNGFNINQHIYISSDEQLKFNDYYTIYCMEIYYCNTLNPKRNNNYKKIILTTDQDLIANGVQAIDDEFLEWFVKNPNCEEVKVNFVTKQLVKPYDVYNESVSLYKIIIPKEEPKQTVQEYEQQGLEKYSNELVEPKQEKMYSEEDVLILLHKRDVHNTDNLNKSKMWQTPKKWFEQIKQKEQ